MDSVNRQVTSRLFKQREDGERHSPYEKEFEFYECVRSGDTKRVTELINNLGGKGAGKLSQDDLRNVKYHFVITAALITRYCVEGGLEMETAYNMSDYYINRCDLCKSTDEVNSLNREMTLEFAKCMKNLSHEKVYSRQAMLCMEYIFNNLHTRLTVKDIANELNLSEGYLSRMFHKEVGVTISEYITTKRVEAAKNLLKYSEYTSLDIANYLCFSSHSHFISIFKKRTGTTPKQYRNRHFRSDWTKSEHKAIASK